MTVLNSSRPVSSTKINTILLPRHKCFKLSAYWNTENKDDIRFDRSLHFPVMIIVVRCLIEYTKKNASWDMIIFLQN